MGGAVAGIGSLVLIHSLLLATFAAAAQAAPPPGEPQPAKRDSVFGAALARLRPGKTIRIHLIGNGLVEGQFVSGSATTLTLAGTPAPAEHPVAALDSLWVRGTGAKKGAIIGAISGGLLGTTLVAFTSAGCVNESDQCSRMIPVVILGGAASGGLLGALIGSGSQHWRRRVP